MGGRGIAEIAGYGLALTIAAIGTWLMLSPAGPEVAPSFPHFDKLAHFAVFFAIALPAIAVRPGAWLWIVLSASALGGIIEIIQPFFGREREFGDFVADVLGALAAVPPGHALARRLSKSRQLQEREGT